MDGYRDLRLVLTALRAGRVDPARLAEVGLGWAPETATPFWEYLVERGIVAPEPAAGAGQATTVYQPPSTQAGGEETPSLAADGSTPSFATPNLFARETVKFPDAAGQSAANGPLADPAARYEVLRQHRIGGIGEVWLARDATVGREVALKRLRPDRTNDPDLRARFVREARTTGQLEHPCVVPLYDLLADAGGRGPCYVMRFVAGRTLAEAVADYHASRAKSQAGRLELAALLDAFVAVCRAIAYAHSKGILHRDLKGQNVVLGDFGEVFLIDWGLAKPVGEVDVAPTPMPAPAGPDQPTRSGAVVGTPAYMAPEVAAGGPASKASDVYGLGAVLYAILSGRPPYDGADPWTVIERVIATDPPPPRSINPDAPPALEAVCRKAMARDPADRYGTADELATEVRRWLADEPVAAYRDPWTVRATRWARRHRTTVAAATVFLLTALVGLAASTALVWNEERRTADQKRIAEQEWKRAEGERERAEGNFALAWDLTSGLSDAVTAVETGTSPTPRSDTERRQFLDRALTASERFLADRPNDDELRIRTARLLRYNGNLGRLLNDTDKADRSYLESVRLQEGPLGQPPGDPEQRDYLSRTLRDYASFQKRVGRLGEAAQSIDRAVGMAVELRALDPTSARYRRTLAVALLDRAGIDYPRGRFTEAERGAWSAADMFGDLIGAPPGQRHPLDPLLRAMATTLAATARRELARSAADPKPFPAALEAHDAAVGQYEDLIKTDESRDVRHNYYRSLVQRARTAAAAPDQRDVGRADLDKAIGGWEKLMKEYPATPLYQEGLATGHLVRGVVRTKAAPSNQAEQDLMTAVKLLESLVKRYPNLPAYRGLLGEAWAGLARLPADRAVIGDRVARSAVSYRTAIKWDPGNALHSRAYQEVQKEWKAAGLESYAAPPKR